MIIISIIFFAATILAFMNPESRARSKWVFLVNPSAVQKIENQRNTSNLPYAIKRLLYNRPVYFVTEFGKNYLRYFSPQYLFVNGGTQYQFSVPNHGLEYIINLPFFYLGLALFFIRMKKEKNDNTKLILLWLILSPIAASITSEKFAVLRSSTMIPLVEITTGIGFIYILDLIKTKKKLLISLYLIITAILVIRYLSVYFGGYAKDYSWSWQYGYKEAANYVRANYDKYDKIIVTKKYGEPHEFLLFFFKYDPIKYRNDINLIRFFQSDWYWVDRFDKFYFVNDWQVKEMKLEIDATVQYARGKTDTGWWAAIKASDIDEIDSPYNTYKYKGLPVGPISNPGLESIIAAIKPTSTKYYYYLTGKDGVMRYSITYNGHLKNKNIYLN